MKPLPWSHSALDLFLQCPKRYYHTRVAKDIDDPPNEAAMWGDRVHRAFEAYLANGTPLDPELSLYQEYLDKIKAIKGTLYPEYKMALDTKLTPCDWKASNVFVRAIADALVVDNEYASLLDHKTGKPKPDSRQLQLSAILTFAHFPNVSKVKTGFFWLKNRTYDSETFYRSEIPVLWANFLPDLNRFRLAFALGIWHPRQSGLCAGWCPVTTCDYWKPKRVIK